MYFCPACDGKTTVTHTVAEIRRRRCKTCGKAFYTEEIECDGTPRIPWAQNRKDKETA